MHDVLGRVLEETELRGRVYCETVARSPWGVNFDRVDQAMFHFVTEGGCWLFAGRTRQELVAGDLVLVAPNTSHALADHEKSRRVRLSDWLTAREPGESRIGGNEGRETRVICGVYEFEHAGPEHPVLRLLPRTLHLSAQRIGERPELASTMAALAREHASGGRGASLVVSRLLEVVFVQALRTWADDEPPGGAGFIGALGDPALSRALAALHDDLGRAWSVTSLARVAGTSRATLGRRFSAEVGESPLGYLTRARMTRAAQRIETSDDGLAAVAHDLGYSSEFAFSRAFRRQYGVPPGEYRRRHAGSLGAASATVSPERSSANRAGR
ncbi:MAG TPA: AraC family transcriptional regulator [Polyangiaceae bacterium]|jgi:AraC-like DNA-binding protein|nr:AraC family transcriptional regulator [Polyangiaceae bacterium]